MKKYACVEFINHNGMMLCTHWQEIQEYSGFKLTNVQMSEFIFAIALLFATVAVFKIIRRAFF